MSVWMEIRCDHNGPDCWDHNNRMMAYGAWSKSVVFKRAREKGWRVERDGSAICPACRNASQQFQEGGNG